jgi:glutaredoxin 3
MTVKIYGDDFCPYCTAARMLLTRRGVAFEDISVSADPQRLAEMQRLSGCSSVPQIFIGDRHVGGFDALSELEMNGELDKLLAED